MNHPDAPIAFLSNREDAPAYWQVDILWLIHASVQQTGGAYSLIEEFCPKDSGPPPHYHDQDEGFYLLEGEITFQAGDQSRFRAVRFIRFVSIVRLHISSTFIRLVDLSK
jgi:hypothetical protein